MTVAVHVGEKVACAPVALAGNGKDGYLAAWSNFYAGGRGAGSPYGLPFGAARVDSEGKALDNIVLGGPQAKLKMPEAAWDGKGYLIAHWEDRAAYYDRKTSKCLNRIAVHLIAADGKYEGAATVSSGEPRPGFAPAVAGDGRGNALVVYESHPGDNDKEDRIPIAARVVKR